MSRLPGLSLLPLARLGWLTLAVGVQGAWAAPAAPAKPSGVRIYSCVDSHGQRLTSDRPIPQCLDREQRLLNKDGSQKAVLPPRLTPAERAARDAQAKQTEKEEQAYKDAVRRDRNLRMRYPDEATHQKAREAALDDTRKAIASSERRVADLRKEREPLQADAEFYKGRPMPFKLKSRLDANDTSLRAQQDIIENQHAELIRINTMFDAELARLRKLWSGAGPAFDAEVPASIKARTPGAAP